MILRVDEEVQGINKEITSVSEMKAAVVTLIDEDVIEVSIKKRAAIDNSPEDEIDEAVKRFISR